MQNKYIVSVAEMENGINKCFNVEDVNNGFMKDAWTVYNILFIVVIGKVKEILWIKFTHYTFRFYVFVCSICNEGKHFLRRLEMKWVDLVHLMLFNLTSYNTKKYYDLDSVIIPYINDNWHALQLPPKVSYIVIVYRSHNFEL